MTEEQSKTIATIHHALRQTHTTADIHAALEGEINKVVAWLSAPEGDSND